MKIKLTPSEKEDLVIALRAYAVSFVRPTLGMVPLPELRAQVDRLADQVELATEILLTDVTRDG